METELPESIKTASRKEKISLLRAAGFTGIAKMTDEQLNLALLNCMRRISEFGKKGAT